MYVESRQGQLLACTAAYTGINAWVAHEMREGNRIQAQVAAAAIEQARAARDTNEIQGKALQTPRPTATLP
jgi:hypothetical protein